MLAQGVIAALVTPFEKETESLDFHALERIIDVECKAGVDAVFVNGTTAEAYAMSFEEKRDLLEKTMEYADKRCKVIMGAGGSTTAKAVAEVEMACELGADGVSVITPYFVTPNQEELYDFYAALAKVSSVPIIMYNHPLRTSVTISSATAKKLHEDYPIIEGLKDSSGNMTSNINFIMDCGEDFGVLSGNDGMIIPMMRMGGKGVVSATANFFPELIVALYQAAAKKDWDRAVELQKIAFEARKVFALGTYPVCIKEAAEYAGYDMGPCRKPVHPLNSADKKKLETIMNSVMAMMREAGL